MINISDIITLSDNNRYSVVSKTKKDEVTYYLLIDEKDNSNIKFCYEEPEQQKIKLVEINDKNLIRSLLLPFYESVKDLIS